MRNYLYRIITDQQDGFFASLIKFILLILSFVYRGVIALRNILYQKKILRVADLGKPVISVGNITWGGVGKTPFVILLAKHLLSRGVKPAILTRGYMQTATTGKPVSDEAAMMRQYLPDVSVGVGADRVKACQSILSSQAVDTFILDDGFQHQKVARALDIVLLDATNPFGNGELIPRGILREPLSALKRSQIIVLTKSDANPSVTQVLEERIKHINKVCVIAWAEHTPQSLGDLASARQEPLTTLRGRKIISFCSIGDPQSFEDSLLLLGADIKKDFVFPDHYVYSASDMEKIIKQADQLGVEDFVTTAKDAVKILQFKSLLAPRHCWVLNIEIELRKGKEKVFERIDHLLGC